MIDILADILRCAVGGVRKTKLMYAVGLNYGSLRRYVDLAVKLGLLCVEFRGRYVVLRTTDKGLQFLQLYEMIRSFLDGGCEE